MTRTFEDLYPTAPEDRNAYGKRSLLLPTHTAAANARVYIAHAQLRHLIFCPQRRGIVFYASEKSIVERDLLNPHAPPRCIVEMEFSATCFAATSVGSNPNNILFAAGGYHSNLHLSLHSFPPSTQTSSSSPYSASSAPKLIWKYATRLPGRTEIVNSILFSPVSLTDDTRRSSSDLRMAVSGNDTAVKFYDIGMQHNLSEEQRIQRCGIIKLDTPINHMSISPDGRTLLCVGDTPEAYLFNISPGPVVTFSPLATYTLPAPPFSALPPSPTMPPVNFRSLACFTTAWSADGLKFAVASQEGQLCVWDVRSARPLFTFWTTWRPNSTSRGRRLGEWEWEDLGGHGRLSEDATNNGPDSGIRNVRFSAGEGGRELMVFTEHTTNLHVIDARTFDPATHSVIPFPDVSFGPSPDPSIVTTIPARSPPPPTVIRASTPPQVVSPTQIIFPRREGYRARSRSPPRVSEATSPHSPRPSVFVVSGSLSRSRSRSPPIVVIPPPLPLPAPPPPAHPDERDLYWPPSSRDFEAPESRERERLDADGDVIEGRDMSNLGGGDYDGDRLMIVDPSDPSMRWPRRAGRLVRLGMTRVPVLTPEVVPLESVAESGEPVPQRPTHLAGLCLDPSGGWVYVASEMGIVEWRVREREEGKTCWGSGEWA